MIYALNTVCVLWWTVKCQSFKPFHGNIQCPDTYLKYYHSIQGGRNEFFLGEAQKISPFFLPKSLKFPFCKPLNLGEA